VKKRIYVGLTALLVIFLGVGITIWTNYYSIVADVRETFINVDATDAYVYGEVLFETRGCVFCHTLSEAGSMGIVGPVLDGIGTRSDINHIRESIVNPNALIATNCGNQMCEPDIMPQFGDVLDEAQVEALVVYLVAQ